MQQLLLVSKKMADDNRNVCSEISNREKQKFDHFSLKSSQGTHGVAGNMTVCNLGQFHDP